MLGKRGSRTWHGGEKVENDPSSLLEADSMVEMFYSKHKQLFRIESILREDHSVTAIE